MNKLTRTYLAILLAAFMISGCGPKKAAEKTGEEVIVVKTQPVSTVAYSPTLEYSGLMASTSQTKLSFKIAGIIARVYVKEGDHVSPGQLLATLNKTEINAQVEQAAAGAEKAKRDAGRMKNLYNDTVVSLEQYQNVQTQLNVANQSLHIARFNRDYAEIHAPGYGTVIKKIMNEGELATVGSPVLLVNGTSGNDWVIRFGVPDKEWAVLQKGNEATVDMDAYPATQFKGLITKIAEVADPVGGTYEVEVKVLPADKKFAQGLFANIHINTSAKQQLTLVPIEALTEGDGKKGFVYTLNPGDTTVTRHEIKIAYITGDKVAVSSGLDGFSSVITDGVSYLTGHSKVKIP
jgi:membrane fusion protein, multidrug efflux system